MLDNNIIQGIQVFFQFLLFIVVVYNFVFFIWILSTWIPVNRSIAILQFVDNLINPVYYTLLRILPPLRFGIMDFSPFYMFIFLTVVEIGIKMIHNITMSLLVTYLG